MTAVAARAHWRPCFLDGPAGRMFALHVYAEARCEAARGVVFCPPFAEEMNKSRRTVRLAAEALAAAGHEVLVPDLHGTGDSAGEFHDASWEAWLAELAFAGDWLAARGLEQQVFWGMRMGAALAVEAANRAEAERLLLWQPVVNGATFVTQFLRMRLAADAMFGDSASSTAELRALLADGRQIEVGGYTLTPHLVAALDGVDLLRTLPPSPVHWAELVAAEGRPFTAASRKLIEVWEGAGIALDDAKLVGPSFWATPEIAVPAALVEHAGVLGARWRDARGAPPRATRRPAEGADP